VSHTLNRVADYFGFGRELKKEIEAKFFFIDFSCYYAAVAAGAAIKKLFLKPTQQAEFVICIILLILCLFILGWYIQLYKKGEEFDMFYIMGSLYRIFFSI
jgi:uncharacterized membrane protein